MSIILQPNSLKRWSQPQGPVEVDWSNPLSRGLICTAGFFGNSFVNGVTGKLIRTTTQYSTRIVSRTTVGGIGISDPPSGGGYDVIPASDNYYPITVFVNFSVNSSITNSNKLILASSNGAGFPGSSTTSWVLYWHNTAGEKKVGLYLSWNNQTIEFSGVPDGNHTLCACFSNGTIPKLFLDGVQVGAGSSLTPYYYSVGLATTSFQSPTFASSGAGYVLLRGLVSSRVTNGPHNELQAQQISANPWQLFKPTPTKRYIDLGPSSANEKKPIPPRGSFMLGTSQPIVKPSVAPVILKDWKRWGQPQGAVEVDWANPLARGLTLATVNNGSPFLNAVTGRDISTGGTAVSATQKGLATNFTGSNIGFTDAPISADSFTILSLQIVGSGITVSVSSTGGAIGWIGTATSGNVGYGDNEVRTVANTNKVPLLVARSSGSQYQFFADGVLKGTSTLGVYFSGHVALGNYSPDRNYGAYGLLFAAAWNRALSDAEIASISANPWQLFKPVQQKIYVGV